MAESFEANKLLGELLSNDRLSKHEHDVLSTATGSQIAGNDDSRNVRSHNHNTHDDIYFPGNITIQASRRYLESISLVFNTMELLEQILNNLPPIDLLLRVQATCRTMQHMINTSLSLRRKLFRAPDYDVKFIEHLPFVLCGVQMLGWPDYCSNSRYYTFTFTNGIFDRLMSYPALQDLLLSQPPRRTVTVHLRDLYGEAEESGDDSSSEEYSSSEGDSSIEEDSSSEEDEDGEEDDESEQDVGSKEDVESTTGAGITVGDILKAIGRMRAARQAAQPGTVWRVDVRDTSMT